MRGCMGSEKPELPHRFNTTASRSCSDSPQVWAIKQSAWLRLWTCGHFTIKHSHAHNRKYNTGWAGEREMNKTDAVRQQPSQLFIRCAWRDEYSMRAPGPSLYAIHVYFSLTLKIICSYSSLQSGISRGKETKWKMGYITLHCLPFSILLVCFALEINQTCRILCDWFLNWNVLTNTNTTYCALYELLSINILQLLYM